MRYGLWGHAMVLASKMDKKVQNEVTNRYGQDLNITVRENEKECYEISTISPPPLIRDNTCKVY